MQLPIMAMSKRNAEDSIQTTKKLFYLVLRQIFLLSGGKEIKLCWGRVAGVLLLLCLLCFVKIRGRTHDDHTGVMREWK